jgi:hypothetical protein
MRPRFQRFAAMSTVGNLASPCHIQCPDAERAAARPFVAAFRTCTENKFRAAQEFVALAKRDQESAVPVCADQEFLQDRIPLAIGRFQNGERTGGQPGIWEPASNSRFVSTVQVTPIKSVAPCNWGISARRKITRIKQARRSPNRHPLMGREAAWAQCRELRTASYVSACRSHPLRNGPPVTVIQGSPLSP